MKSPFLALTLAFSATFGVHGLALAGETSVPIEGAAPPTKFTFATKTPSGKPVDSGRIVNAIYFQLAQKLPSSGRLDFDSARNTFVASWKWAQGLNYNNLTAEFSLKIASDEQNYIATLECPAQMKSEIRDFSITGIPKWNNQAIGQTLNNTCSTMRLRLAMIDELKGEVDTNYNDTATFANFKRKLNPAPDSVWRQYRNQVKVSALDIEKSQQFLVPTSDGDVIASVAVYPYRNGAKVVYAFGYTYYLNDDGSSTYHQPVIEDIRTRLAAVAND